MVLPGGDLIACYTLMLMRLAGSEQRNLKAPAGDRSTIMVHSEAPSVALSISRGQRSLVQVEAAPPAYHVHSRRMRKQRLIRALALTELPAT